MTGTLYRGMDRATLDAAYSNSTHVGLERFEAYLADWAARSRRVAERFPVEEDLPYGSGPRQRLDFIAGADPVAATVAFIHGGYWQWTDKSTSLFLAEGVLAQGFHFANIEYTLAPAQSMAGMVAEIRAAVRWLRQFLEQRYGKDPVLVVSGHSAGGHLAALALEEPGVTAALPISGLYDLRPIQLGSLNDNLGLDDAAVAEHSPLHRIKRCDRPIWIAVGAGELPELQRQSADYFARCQAAGRACRFLPIPKADHFAVLDALAAPSGVIARALRELVQAHVPPR